MTYTLKVSAIIKETEDAVTFCFKQPALKKIRYYPGQYITVVVYINGRKYKRPYSLSSAPILDNTLNITVKRMLHGVVSNHLIDVIKEGDILEVMGPIGNFVYRQEIHHTKSIFLWGAGSGITPLLSILKTVLNSSLQHVFLIYCNKSRRRTIFYSQLLQLSERYNDRFTLMFFFTEEKAEVSGHGRLGYTQANEILIDKDISNTLHYICGPIGLKQIVKGLLAEKGLVSEMVLSEDFEHFVNENQLTGIQTRFLNLIKDGKNYEIEVVRGKSILEAALDHGVDLPYSCQTGSCTLCKAKLVAGEVKYMNNEAAEHEIQHDERLLCCSYPLTNDIIFQIN